VLEKENKELKLGILAIDTDKVTGSSTFRAEERASEIVEATKQVA
jgi:hypothetical protein